MRAAAVTILILSASRRAAVSLFPTFSDLRCFMSFPVSILTGQFIAQRPSVAQLLSPEYEKFFASEDKICGSCPLSDSEIISRCTTIRCRGVSVRSAETQDGSQNPHSVHLSVISLAGGSGLRFLR